MVKICEYCGRKFEKKGKNQKYCSKLCVKRARSNCAIQLCWYCQSYAGGCNWSKEFKPVDGWIAVPTTIKDSWNEQVITSYRILYCPQFQMDE